MLSVSALSQTTNVNEIVRKTSLGSQVSAILNSTFPDNLLIYGQFNTEVL